jgi:hypothetical protein
MNTTTVRVINPWRTKESLHMREFFEYTGKPVFSFRGVDVYNNYSSWDYVIGGFAITQRAGFHKESAPKIISDILDGLKPVAEGVATRLAAIGFTPMSYDQYNKLWAAGKVA